MSHRRSRLGQQGEELACTHLQGLGYRIVARNYRGRYGEIDLIAEEANTLVFIEVKTRKGESDEEPLENISSHKCRQISKLALYYMSELGSEECAVRFDVVGITLRGEAEAEIEVVRDAFDLTY